LIRHRNRFYGIRFDIRWQWFGSHDLFLSFSGIRLELRRALHSDEKFLAEMVSG